MMQPYELQSAMDDSLEEEEKALLTDEQAQIIYQKLNSIQQKNKEPLMYKMFGLYNGDIH
jgi:hypothetical protein